jgi:hypothetical protein
VTRQLVSLQQLVRDLEEHGEDPDGLYLDPDDVVELEKEPQDEDE